MSDRHVPMSLTIMPAHDGAQPCGVVGVHGSVCVSTCGSQLRQHMHVHDSELWLECTAVHACQRVAHSYASTCM
jgi:hypothetical protein